MASCMGEGFCDGDHDGDCAPVVVVTREAIARESVRIDLALDLADITVLMASIGLLKVTNLVGTEVNSKDMCQKFTEAVNRYLAIAPVLLPRTGGK